MGAVITTLTIGAALFHGALATRVRRIARSVHTVGSVALLAAGAYIIYYWLTFGGLLSNPT